MVDTTSLTMSITANMIALKVNEKALITFTPSEVANDFVLSDITFTGEILSNFSDLGGINPATFTNSQNTNTQPLVRSGNLNLLKWQVTQMNTTQKAITS